MTGPTGEGEGAAELYDQVLAWEMIDQLLFDIGAAAELLGVMVKGGPERHARGAADLTVAAAALRDGATGVQLRYLHNGQEWWDTLIPQGEAVRLVRTRIPAG